MAEPARIPREARPRAYAGVALLLDLLYAMREATGLDYDDMLLWAAASAMGMRQSVSLPGAIEPAPSPDSDAGFVARTRLAEVVGLPRETARRRINALIEAAVLEETPTGRVRVAAPFLAQALQQTADGAFDAAERFYQQLRALGCRGIRD